MIQMERWGSITKGNCLTWGMHDLSQCHTRATHTQKHLKTQKIRFLYKHLKYLHQTLFGGKFVTLMKANPHKLAGEWYLLIFFFQCSVSRNQTLQWQIPTQLLEEKLQLIEHLPGIDSSAEEKVLPDCLTPQAFCFKMQNDSALQFKNINCWIH